MKILYLARHHQPCSADDEGAIAHALRSLGHEVECVPESQSIGRVRADLLLCHHLRNVDALRRVDCPKAFWCFDRIGDDGDPTLAARSRVRQAWLKGITAACDIGFLTDGDAVAADQSGKLHWLPQGADERVVGRGAPWPDPQRQILFTGSARGCGVRRESFVREMSDRWWRSFRHVEKGTYGRELAGLIASSAVVVAPDFPVSDRYWSNRVYVALGFGAFLLHPWSKGLFDQLMPADDPPPRCYFYSGRQDLHGIIGMALTDREFRRSFSERGLETVRAKHLYRHRVEELLRIVKERL